MSAFTEPTFGFGDEFDTPADIDPDQPDPHPEVPEPRGMDCDTDPDPLLDLMDPLFDLDGLA